MEGWPGWVYLGGWLHTEMVYLPADGSLTHLSTNWAWHWITLLTLPTTLPTKPHYQHKPNQNKKWRERSCNEKQLYKDVKSYRFMSQFTHISDVNHFVPVSMVRQQHGIGVNLASIVYFHAESQTIQCHFSWIPQIQSIITTLLLLLLLLLCDVPYHKRRAPHAYRITSRQRIGNHDVNKCRISWTKDLELIATAAAEIDFLNSSVHIFQMYFWSSK